MGRTGLWGWPWLLLLWDSGFQAAGLEEKLCLPRRGNLIMNCTYTMNYVFNVKALQRVRSQGPPEILVRTSAGNTEPKRFQDGRYLLEDDPDNVIFRVTVTEVQKQDLGLYQCVIDLSPRDLHNLPTRIRVVECGASSARPSIQTVTASDNNPTQTLALSPTLPPIITTTSTVTQLQPTSPDSSSSPGLGVNPTPGTDFTGISLMSIVVVVVCGILSKSLTFTVLLVFTQRLFGP